MLYSAMKIKEDSMISLDSAGVYLRILISGVYFQNSASGIYLIDFLALVSAALFPPDREAGVKKEALI